MEQIIKIIEDEIYKFKAPNKYKKVTYNIGYAEGLKFVKDLLENYMKKRKERIRKCQK